MSNAALSGRRLGDRSRDESRAKEPPGISLEPGFRSYASLWGRIGWATFIALCVLSIAYGLVLARRGTYTPEQGVGYWLGIAGGTVMLMLLAYPLQKRSRWLLRLGGSTYWFAAHMVLGIVGPILILYHCNFSLGAVNSNVALFSMLLVAISGIGGRFVYGKIHHGLFGARENLGELLSDAIALMGRIEKDVGGGGLVARELQSFGEASLIRGESALGSLWISMRISRDARRSRRSIMHGVRLAIAQNAPRMGWDQKQKRSHEKDARRHVDAYLGAVVRAQQLSFYERLFALWHVLHIPFFFLLIITAIVHVVAVHLY